MLLLILLLLLSLLLLLHITFKVQVSDVSVYILSTILATLLYRMSSFFSVEFQTFHHAVNLPTIVLFSPFFFLIYFKHICLHSFLTAHHHKIICVFKLPFN